MNCVNICNEPNIKVNGRTIDDRNPVILLWTGSSIEMNVKCSELQVLIEAPYETYENWIAIEINGEVISRRMLNKEHEWITVFRGMNRDNITHVRIIKESQVFSGDNKGCIRFFEVRLDGEILPVSDDKLKIEFIGDSINSAEGTIGAKSDQDWIPQYFSHINSYPYFTGKALDADVRVFSQSGWGSYVSWDDKKECAIPNYYEEICSLVAPDVFDRLGFYEKWDFTKWQPDFIVVNLGTNDDGAFHFTDNVAEKNLKMAGDEYIEEDRIKVRNSMYEFLLKIRKNNPNAFIFWAFGILGNKMVPTINEAIDMFKKETGDENIGFISLPEVTEETTGSRSHPGRKAHELCAECVIDAIKNKINK